MVTNQDIELAFVRAQNRINEGLDRAQFNFYLPDLVRATDEIVAMMGKNQERPKRAEDANPLAMNEEVS